MFPPIFGYSAECRISTHRRRSTRIQQLIYTNVCDGWKADAVLANGQNAIIREMIDHCNL